MAQLTQNFLNLIIFPFTDHVLFIWIGGILCCTWLFSTIYKLIFGYYK